MVANYPFDFVDPGFPEVWLQVYKQKALVLHMQKALEAGLITQEQFDIICPPLRYFSGEGVTFVRKEMMTEEQSNALLRCVREIIDVQEVPPPEPSA